MRYSSSHLTPNMAAILRNRHGDGASLLKKFQAHAFQQHIFASLHALALEYEYTDKLFVLK